LFFPDKLVLKQRGYQPEDGHGYEREKAAYFKLRHLQGSLIPRYYGEVSCGYMPAIIMSEEAGKELLEFSMTKVETKQVLNAVKAAYEALAEAGVIHGDPELHNFLWDGKRLIVIDFNGAEFYTGEKGEVYSDADYREVERRLVRTSL
jgi:RIO-like serine/threonine protein kinase